MEEKKIQNKNVLFLFLIIIILIGGFLVYNNFNNKEEQKIVVEKSPIEITNNDDGTKTVRNVEEGYEVEVNSELNVDFIDGKLSIQSQDNINQILPDLSFILQKTNKTSALIFFKEEFNKLNDQGLQVEELSSFELNNVIVDYIKVDYKNSEWTSNGEVIYIYHFVIKEQNFIIVDTSFNENILKNNINKIKSFISSIKN